MAGQVVSPTLFVIDGFSYAFQAFFGVRPLTAPDGAPTQAVFGFAQMLMKVLREEKPDALLAAFDTPEPTFRHQRYAGYKASRAATPDDLLRQIPVLFELLAAFGVPVTRAPGWEADDLIATVTRAARDAGVTVNIVSRDKDLYQVLDDGVFFYTPADGSRFGLPEFRAKWGMEPSQVPEYLGMRGDDVDDIPGIPGVGEKTARDLIAAYGSVDGLYGDPGLSRAGGCRLTAKQKQNIAAFRDQALLSRDLARVRADAPVEPEWTAYRLRGLDGPRVAALFTRLGFKTLLAQLEAKEAGVTSAVAAARREQAAGVDWRCVNTPEQLRAFVNEMSAQREVAFDTETTGLREWEARLVGCSFSWKERQAFYLPVRAPLGERTLPEAEVLAAIRPALENPAVRKVGQNIKFDALIMRWRGIALRGAAFDTMIAGALLNAGAGGHGLDRLAQDYLGHQTIPITSLIGEGRKQITMDRVPLGAITPYAAEDADIALRLARVLLPRLKAEGLWDLFTNIEMPLVETLTDMEATGIRVDADLLRALSRELAAREAALEAEIHALAGHAFNVHSPKQLEVVLFDELGLESGRRTKTGRSTDAEVLETLA
ncbi:MAG: DNA polymerase I, partial [Planctomycetes bacterium]|nr:DNA polymerase I [Planctomycetota bacterium]